jgi:hypothetical protein
MRVAPSFRVLATCLAALAFFAGTSPAGEPGSKAPAQATPDALDELGAERILSLDFSSDGARLAVGGHTPWPKGGGPCDGLVLLLDAASGQEQTRLRLSGKTATRASSNFARRVRFSPDGRTVAVGDVLGVTLWDPAAGKASRLPLQAWSPGRGDVRSLAFSPDGKVLAVAGDSAVELWDVATPRLLHGLKVRDGTALAFSPDGKLLALSAGGPSPVQLWDPAAGRLLAEDATIRGWLRGLAFSPDGTTLAGVGSGFHAWGVAARRGGWALERQAAVHGPSGDGVAYSPDGRLLVTTTDDGTVRLWEAAGRRLRAALPHRRGRTAARFSPDGKMLAAAGQPRQPAPGRKGTPAVTLWKVADLVDPGGASARAKAEVTELLALARAGKFAEADARARGLNLADPGAVRLLVAGIEDPNPDVRSFALHGLRCAGFAAEAGAALAAVHKAQEDESRAAFTPDGWFRTGDLGGLDSDGYLTVTGRIKEILVRDGEKIMPREVEEVLERHPNVLEAAVVGEPDGERGDAVVAFVAPGDEVPTADELRAFCHGRLAEFKIPRRFVIAPDLPRGPTGKVLKRALKDWQPGKEAQAPSRS